MGDDEQESTEENTEPEKADNTEEENAERPKEEQGTGSAQPDRVELPVDAKETGTLPEDRVVAEELSETHSEEPAEGQTPEAVDMPETQPEEPAQEQTPETVDMPETQPEEPSPEQMSEAVDLPETQPEEPVEQNSGEIPETSEEAPAQEQEEPPSTDEPPSSTPTTGEGPDKTKTGISAIRAALAAAAKGDRMKVIAKDLITATKTLFTRVRGYGLELEEEKKLFKEAIIAIKSEEYIKGAQLTTRVKKMLGAAEEKYFIESISGSLTEVEEMLNQAREVDIEVPPLEEAHLKHKTALENKEYEKLEDLVAIVGQYHSKATSQLNALIETRLTEVIENEIASIPETVENARSLEVDISEEMAKLEIIEKLKQEEKNREAYDKLREVKTSLSSKILERMVEVHTRQLEEAKVSLEGLVELTGKEYSELRTQLESSEKSLAESDFDGIVSILQEFGVSIEAEKNAYFFEKYSLAANEFEAQLAPVKELGINVTTAEGILAEINDKIVESDFEKVESLLTQLQGIVENAKTTEARKLASTLLADTKLLYNRLNEADVELGQAKDTFKEGIMSIKSQDFVKGCQVLMRTKELLEGVDQKYLSDSLSSALEEALRFYTKFEKIEYFAEADKEELRKILDDTQSSLENDQLQNARDGMKSYGEMKEEIDARIEKYNEACALSEKMNELLASAQELSIDIEAEEALLVEAGELMEDYILEETIAVYQQAEAQFNEKIENQLLENANSVLSRATELFEGFKENISDTGPIEAKLAAANELLEQREYEKSIETATEVIESVETGEEDKLKSEIRRLFDTFIEVVDECEELGVDVMRPQALLFKAKTAFERGDLAKAQVQSQNGLTMALENKKEFLKENASDSRKELQDMLDEAVRLEIDHSSIMEMVLTSQELFEKEDFVEARKTSENAKGPLKELLGTRLNEMIRGELGSLAAILKEAKALGIDIEPEKTAISSASKLKNEGKYYEAIDSIRSIKDTVTAKVTGDFKDKANGRMEEANNRLTFIENEGCNADEARRVLDEAVQMIDAGKCRESIEVIDNSFVVGDRLFEEYQQMRCQEIIREMNAFLSEIVEVTGGKVELNNPTELLNQATARLEDMDFEAVRNMTSEAHAQADRLYYHYVIDSLLATHDFLLEVKNLGANVAKAQELFTSAKASLEKKNYPEAIEHSKKALETTKDSRISYMRDEIGKNQKVAASLAEKLRVKEIDVRELDESIASVKMKLDDEDIAGAFEMAKEARVISLKFRDDYKKGTVEIVLDENRKYIKDLDEFGVDTADIVSRLKTVKVLLEKKKFPEALVIGKELKKILVERYNEHYHSLLTANIKETREYLEEISEKVDITKPTSTLKEAEEALAKNDFENCEEMIKKSRHMGEKSRHASLVIEAANVLAYGSDIIREGIREGADVSDMNAMLMEASEAFEDREYQTVIDICATIGAGVDKYKEDKLSNIAKNAVRNAKTIIEAAKDIKADVKEPTSKYKDAMAAYKEGKFKVSLDLAEEAREIASHSKDFRAATVVIDTVRNRLDEIDRNGNDISEAKEIFEAVQEAMNGNDFDKAREMARDSIKKAMAINMFNSVSTGIERSQEYVSFALDSEIFVKDYFQETIQAEDETPEGKCPKCGQDVPEKAMFCLWCGHRLGQ